MFAQLIVVLAVLALAIADPVKPTLPSQYMVTDINMVMDTNAGYPPHYTEEGTCVCVGGCLVYSCRYTGQSYCYFPVVFRHVLTPLPPLSLSPGGPHKELP